MSAKKCAPDCVRARERRRRALERSEHVQRYHRSGASRSTRISDQDIEISDATDYQSLPGRSSSPSHESRSSREYIQHVETPTHTSEESLGESSMCLSGRDSHHHPTRSSKKDYKRYEGTSGARREKLHFAEDPESSSRSAMNEHRTHRRAKRDDGRNQANCRNEDCSPPKSNILFRRRQTSESEDPRSDSETQSGQSESDSLICPELCERDLLRLPSPKSTCESSCQKQAWLDKQRAKRQAQVDRYILNKGLNYFEDLCHCSLKCLMTQICMDPFVKKTAASAAFFFLGIKLCFELDSWYIPFR